MTTITIELPDDLALRASRVGVLDRAYVSALIEEATRYAAANKLRDVWLTMDAVDTPIMSNDELAGCIQAVRAAHRAVDGAQGSR